MKEKEQAEQEGVDMKQPGEFLKQKQMHKARQKLYDKVSQLRNGQEIFITFNKSRFCVRQSQCQDEYGLSLVYIRGHKVPTIVHNYEKNGNVTIFGTDRFVGVGSIKEWLGTATEV